MSASGREVAHRLFAAEYDEATYSYSESDEERAPNYVVTPTGARVNRLFFVGVLTEVERVSDDVLRARVVDPTGAFVVYAGQYQPDEMAFLEEAEPPMFVAVTGKARTFSPDDSDRVFTSVRPESINEVDADTRDRWTVQAAEATLARVATFRGAIDLDLTGDRLRTALGDSGVSESLAAGIPVALEQYGTTENYLAALADVALDALELVVGTTDEVATPSITPGDAGGGTVDAAAIAEGIDGAVVDLEAPSTAGTGDAESAGTDDAESAEMGGEVSTGADDELTSGSESSGGTTSGVDDSGETSSEASGATSENEATSATGDDTEPGEEGEEPAAGEQPAADDGEEVSEPSDGEATAVDDASEADDGTGDELGDFEPSEGAADDEVPEDVIDEEERERIEEEYGTDFSTGSEVGEPGEAGIEPEAGPIEPDDAGADEPAAEPDEASDTASDEAGLPPEGESSSDDSTVEDESGGASADADEGAPSEDDEGSADPDDVDLEAAVLDAMDDLDEGDGADREAVVAAVVGDHGVDPGAVEEAIQDALMAGKCYEPDDESVKPI